jgi:carbonic anhydrase/acetyltransferase-like protein (isoleucine patch superfamily)
MINDNSKPLILLGSPLGLWFIADVCTRNNIKIHGIIDNDYFGNKEHIENVPVIDTEKSFEDPGKVEYYKENFNFFNAVPWAGQNNDPVHLRDYQKRCKFIDLIEKHDLNCITIVDHTAIVHPTNKIGKNVFIDCYCYISAYNDIGDYTSIYAFSAIAHHNKLGKNCVMQRRSGVHAYNTLEDDVYVGLQVQVWGENLLVKKGTVIHPLLGLNRNTEENELISIAGKDLRRVYHSAF